MKYTKDQLDVIYEDFFKWLNEEENEMKYTKDQLDEDEEEMTDEEFFKWLNEEEKKWNEKHKMKIRDAKLKKITKKMNEKCTNRKNNF